MKDVPLEYAMIAWSKNEKVVVIHHPDNDENMKRLGLNADIGAANSDWARLSTVERLAEILRHAFVLALEEGIPIEKVREAYEVIPEFRDYMAKA